MSTPGGFRDGIIGKDHPYLTAVTNSSASNSNERGRNKQRTDGVVGSYIVYFNFSPIHFLLTYLALW